MQTLMKLFKSSLIIGLLLSIICLSPFSLCANTNPTDSLKHLLNTEKDANKRCELYVHLGDLHSNDSLYWESALQEAIKANNDPIMRIALKALVNIKPENYNHYLSIAHQSLNAPGKKLFISYLHGWNIWLRPISNEGILKNIREDLERMKQQEKALTTEEQIEWEFITAHYIDVSTVSDNYGADIERAIPHIETALQLLRQYPLEQRYDFEKMCRMKLINLYMANPNEHINRKAIEETDKLQALYEQYQAEGHEFKNRPFYDYNYFNLTICGFPLYLTTLTKHEAEVYYKRFMQVVKLLPEINEKTAGYIFDTQSCYYNQIGDYRNAIVTLDSVIAHRKRYNQPIDLIAPYIEKTQLYQKLGDYKNAFTTLLLADSLQSNIKMAEARQSTAEMQARFDVNKLELEKAQMSAHHRLIYLYVGFAFLLCLVAWISYLMHTMRKLHTTQQELLTSNAEIIRQKEKVTASEEMKTCFIQSMCHEIRTPMNAINGFTSLLLDKSISDDDKEDFPHIIKENTQSLSNIIDNMLEMSTLIASNEKLPTEDTDIYQICLDAIQKRKNTTPQYAGLTFTLDAVRKCTIQTHYLYLYKVLDQLLENAIKFTQIGNITLSCYPDVEDHCLIISVTDTGIGIAPDKQEWIFERFTKVDSFKPGVGVGLFLCRIIITRLGGKIYIDPEYKEGCRVIIELPLTSNDAGNN